MEQPLVSVIIPTYNRENYIIKTLENILHQTYKNIEVIIIDDGSIDDTNGRIEDFIRKKNAKNIKYYWQENSGVSSARNLGIEKSKGEFIAFQDSDDLWKADKLEKQVNCILQKNSNICYCGTIKKFLDYEQKINNKFEEEEVLTGILKAETDAQTITWLINRQFLEINNIKFEKNCRYSEDLEFFIKCVYLGNVSCVKEYMSYYVNNEESLSNNILNQLQEIEMWKRLKSWMIINRQKSKYNFNEIEKLIDKYRMPSRLIYILYNLKNKNNLEFIDIYRKYKKDIYKFNPIIGNYKKTFLYYYINVLIHGEYLNLKNHKKGSVN